ncbi:MAG: fibrobacter succinogenes major paralogous domain-containing protein [Fibrobacteraceae bacterium]|nr:fibrobacter succinogenes major paralogous domain-containing protein [Fibrobacteraceae bacterium]
MKFGIQKMALSFVCTAALIFTACDSDSSSANNVLSSGDEEISSSSNETGSNSGKANWAYLNQDVFYGEFTDDRDGQVYKTTAIGFQNWMAENLNYADSLTTPSLKGRSWCYENSADSCAKYGRLYTWAAVIDSVSLYNDNNLDCGYGKACTMPDTVYGICPEGWHLPTRAEWYALYNFVDYEQNIGVGMALKAKSGWTSYSVAPTGKDAYGFSALPAGFRQNDGMLYFVCSATVFLSSSEYDSSDVYIRFLDSYNENFNNAWDHKNFAYSVRCLQN